jgi:uncharacterized protein
MNEWIQKRMPSQEAMSQSRVMRPFAKWIFRRELWRWKRESVARGAALGIFFGFSIPILQMLCAAIAAVYLRGNIPISALSTMVTNPLTFPPLYVAAYQFGSLFIDHVPSGSVNVGWFAWLLNWFDKMGPPTILGLFIFAIVGAITMYFFVKAVWKLRTIRRRRTPLSLRVKRVRAAAP